MQTTESYICNSPIFFFCDVEFVFVSSNNRFCYRFALAIEFKTQKLTTKIAKKQLEFDQTHAKWHAVSNSHNGIVCMHAYAAYR